ncbi:hypothetical protein ABZ707_06185 [Streptomyces sp. NPDC006923]|uniref:hypothetical protein n=1 Tax=Streptomyces sp. NPDC006923 TaxID=3155355 RepID=UPI0033DD2D95
MAHYPASVWIRAFAYPAILVGFVLFLFFAHAVFSDHEVDCDGQEMNPGQVCGANALTGGGGRSYESMATEASVNRGLGYAGMALLTAGIPSAVFVEVRSWHRGGDW